MKPSLRLAVDELIKAGKVILAKEDRKRIIGISPSTIDRLFKKYRKRPKIKGRSYTKPGTLLKSQIPIRTFSEWNENKEVILPGHWTLLMLNLPGLNKQLCLIKLRFMCLQEFRELEPDYLFLCWDLILIVEQNSSMISCIDTASRNRLLLPEAGLARKMITHT
jgi:hypothetical protein